MPAGRILIVEDDAVLLRGLTDTFEGKGYEVMSARDGEKGIELALERNPEIVLLDIMLPRVNGYEVCRVIREHGLQMPIVMLTAKGQEEDVILGLNLGADDYVTKPFRIGELVARANAFLRRSRVKVSNVCAFGDCRLDLAAHKLFRNDREVELTAKEFKMLTFFASRPGRALTRDDILDAVWGRSIIVTPRSIDRCVVTLRAKVEPDPRNPIYIQTIRDIGYRFEPGNSN
jgi:DNA-binding response OmpR family regulator